MPCRVPVGRRGVVGHRDERPAHALGAGADGFEPARRAAATQEQRNATHSDSTAQRTKLGMAEKTGF